MSAPEGMRPDMAQALADLRELRELFSRFGVELIGSLTGIAEGLPPHICGEVLDTSAAGSGANDLVCHFKLAEHLQRCLAALRAWNSDLHVTHDISPEMVSAGELELLGVLGGSVEVFWSPSDLAISVYLAMRALDRP